MLLKEEREAVVKYGKKLVNSSLTVGTGGNVSIFNREKGLVVLSPSGVDYFEISPKDVAILQIDGKFAEYEHSTPTTETELHMALYRRRPDVCAVVHCHSIYATTLACLGWEIPAVNYMIAVSGNKVPITPYATYGSQELARNVAENIGDYNAALMANHGQVAVGGSIAAAFTVALNVEYVARLYYQAKCAGNPVILSDEQVRETRKQFISYGQHRKSSREY